jgi:hypothetical protein
MFQSKALVAAHLLETLVAEATVIPATLPKPKHAASEYGQALSNAPWENRIDTSRDLGDGIDPDLLPPEQLLE